jgi:predicted ArsR family transcriptional regulator
VARRRRHLSSARAAILDILVGQPEPCTVAALSALTGQHPNTVREHLDGLTEAGLVVRTRAAAQGRGRPAWLFSAAREASAESGSREYAALASALASHIARTSAQPRVDAIEAGLAWGHELARQSDDAQSGADSEDDAAAPPASPSALAIRRKVVSLVDGLGFAPTTDARVTVIKLHRCPLLEAAHQHPDVVCGVHLGLVRGALDELGADPARTEETALQPFSEPGVCRLDLLPRSAAATG